MTTSASAFSKVITLLLSSPLDYIDGASCKGKEEDYEAVLFVL
jgi:hypothetical protein